MHAFPGTPPAAAHLLTHMLDALAASGQASRFPVDVADIALRVSAQFGWKDPIVDVKAAPITSFEGGLFTVDGGWVLLYNDQIQSEGRIRFTQAHELGHYLLHRTLRNSFSCTDKDMVEWGPGGKLLEQQADEFASALLMPINHFRTLVNDSKIDFEMLGKCADLFGVSLTAAALRWVSFTNESAVLVLSRDGYIDWSVSSDKARKNGAFFRTRGNVIELPAGSLAADSTTASNKHGMAVGTSVWFEHADGRAVLREMKIGCDNYGYSLSLLHLSSGDKVWPAWETR
ncbi:ImmA/IrrE family metallo-endopeptidase [Variovorax boronicumulans]|nr:ImmA/IrrE family metallo-endopeptidase [Variovorax boronicumulans]